MIDVLRSDWTPVAETFLVQAVGVYKIDDIKKQFTDGAGLYIVTEGGCPCGAYLLRIDEWTGGKEGVIIAAAGKVQGVSLLEVILPYIEAQFKAAGCTRIRIHTDRHGLVKVLNGKQWLLGEYVLFKKVD